LCSCFIQIPLVLFYSIYWDMGVDGIWWGIMVASALQAIASFMWFLQKKWQKELR